jgi:hypothetical protein
MRVHLLIIIIAVLGIADLHAWQGDQPYTAACGLGVRWDASENGWTGTWVRRGSSNTFDATWQRDGSTGSSVLTMSLNGSRVHIERRDASSFGGAYVEYDGVVDAAGTVSGTSRVPASGATSPFRAAIQCGDAARSSPAPTADLGATLVAIFPSVCTAIWTRAQPGVYDSVTVCQGPGNASFRETLTVQSYDGKTVIISRPNYGQYRGTLSADHRTIRGTCDWADCTPNYRWTAYIDWNWNDSPPLQ